MVAQARIAVGITAVALVALAFALVLRSKGRGEPEAPAGPAHAALSAGPALDGAIDAGGADADADDASDAGEDAPPDAQLPSPVDDDPLCAEFARVESQRIASMARAENDAAVDAAILPPGQLWCRTTPHGAWAATLGLATFTFHGPDSYLEQGAWSLVHLGRDGTGAAASPSDAGGARFDATYSSDVNSRIDHAIELADDYDGDGEPEVLVREQLIVPEGSLPPEALSLYTFAKGAVVDYPPARGLPLVRVEDADHDGRKDLVFAVGRANDYMTCISQRDFPALEWLARATRGGGFETSGAASRRFVDAQCAKAGRSIVHRTAEGLVAPEATARAIVCARVHGQSPEEIRAAIAKECDDYEDAPMICSGPRPSPRTCFTWMKTLPDVDLPSGAGDAGVIAPPDAR